MAKASPIDDLTATNLSLAIALPLPDNEGLQKFLAERQDPTSTNYNRSLSVDEFVARFSPTEKQYQKAIAFAEKHGLNVTSTYKNRQIFNVVGSVAEIEKLFHVKMKRYQHPKENRHFFAPDKEPAVDADFDILEVRGLENFYLPHPADLRQTPMTTNSVTSFLNSVGSGPGAELTSLDFRNAYAPGVTLRGEGQSIAILQFLPYWSKNIALYEQLVGFNINVTNISVDGFSTTPFPRLLDGEQTLDIDVAAAMAPAARIMCYEGRDMATIFNAMASDGVAKQVSCSWGQGPGVDPAVVNAIYELQAQGQPVFIASGDNGAIEDNRDMGNPGGFPNVTICGGTVLSMTQSGGGNLLSEVAWSGSGGGWCTNFSLPTYQQGVNIAAAHGSSVFRNTPDVCGDAVNFANFTGESNTYIGGAGTSGTAPLWAGYMALVNEQIEHNAAAQILDLNTTLYNIAKGPNYATAFRDMTVGNNTNAIRPTDFFTRVGYDLVTGWGSPTGTNLMNLLAASTNRLKITPGFGFAATKFYGGTVPATSVTFLLTNTSSSNMNWTATVSDSWISVTNTSGTIPAFKSTNITVSLAGAANSLGVGTYTSTVTFTDVNTNVKLKRLCGFTVSAAAQPLALSGFNANVIVPNTGTKASPGAVAFDTVSQRTFYENGLAGTSYGLPVSRRFISSADGQTVFQLAPYALMLGNQSSSATLTLATPQSLSALVVLAASANAGATSAGQVTVKFTDNSTRVFSYNAADWYIFNQNAAISAGGSVNLNDFSVQDDTYIPIMSQTFIPLLLDSTKTVASLTFSTASGASNTAIFAVSGVASGLSGLAPTITQQPQSTTSGDFTNASAFTVAVSGAPPFSYQWYSNSVRIPDAVQQTLRFDANMPTSYAASYSVVVSNQYGSVQSSAATLSIIRTHFTQQPTLTSYTVFAGQTISLSSTATGPLPISYSWQLNGATIPGATTTTLLLTNIQPNSAGVYTLVASTTMDAVMNNPVVVNVVPRPSAAFPTALLKMNPASYWRLDETQGAIAHDYVGGSEGIYTNVVLAQPGYGGTPGTGTDLSELAARFGPTNGAQSYVALPNLDVSVPNGGNGQFAIAAWVKATNTVPNAAGIVAKGYGGGDEEFGLACGANGNAFQFFVRNAQSAAASIANSTVFPDNNWHFVVGVCDQSHGTIYLYVDGTNVAQTTVTAGTGIHQSSFQGSIGARASDNGSPENLQFVGLIDDVALFTNAISASQISTLYNTALYGPVITQQPIAQRKPAIGSNVTNSIVAAGTNLSYQWFGPSGAIAGRTNASMILSNIQPAQSGNYFVVVTNIYGQVQSSNTLVVALPQLTAPYAQQLLALNPLAYWRLNETNGSLALDYANYNEGTYSNVVRGQPGYNSASTINVDPGQVAAQFVSNGQPSYVSIPTVDLGSGDPFTSAVMSFAAWVKADPASSSGAGIVAKGTLGNEQFFFGCGGPNNGFQFFCRNISDLVRVTVQSPAALDNQWHFVVVSCNVDDNKCWLYVDGVLVAFVTPGALGGVFETSVPASIGARQDGSGNYTLQFVGSLADVAVFNHFLLPSQVATLYAAGTGPSIVTMPASQVSFTSAQINAQANPATIAASGWFRWGTTTNYGNTTPAQDLGNGTTPVSFNASLSNLAPGVSYHCQAVISNAYGVFFGNDVTFRTTGNPIVFDAFNWSSNQVGVFTTPTISNNVLRLTDGGGGEARSVFFQLPQYIGAFQAKFTYQDVSGGADGVAFVLQNDPRGIAALGGGGGSLGYSAANPITPSAALEFNLYTGNNQLVGYTFLTNGLTGANGANGNYHAMGSISLASGHPITVTAVYAYGQLALAFIDTVTSATFSTNLNVGDLTSLLGSQTAYVGFTGSDGGATSVQVITNFSFVSIPTLHISLAGATLTFTWPASVVGYSLQLSTDLSSGSWVTLGNQPTVVNGQNQITLPVSNVKTFYRLSLP